jgi:hypothetical protein
METKTFKLSLVDRIAIQGLLQLLPGERSKTSIILEDGINAKVELTTEEIAKYEITDIIVEGETRGFNWNSEGAKSNLDVEFFEVELDLIKQGFEVLTEKDKFTRYHLQLEKKLNM